MAGTTARGRVPSVAATQLCDRLRESRSQLMTAISGLNDATLRARHGPGVWTAAELLAHLLSTERIFIDRARKVVDENGYAVTPASDDMRNEHLDMARRMPVPQIVHGLLAQRRATLALIETLTQDDLQHTLTHPRRGEQTAVWQIEHVIEHELEHAAEIRARRGTESEAS